MDIVSKSKHPQLWKASGVEQANTVLMSSVVNSREVALGSLHLRCLQCHLANGLFRKGDHFRTHKHAEIQIEIPLLGQFEFGFENAAVLVKPGQALVIPAQRPHRWQTPTGGFMMGLQVSVKDDFGVEVPLPFVVREKPIVVASAATAALIGALIDLAASVRNTAFTPARSAALLTALITSILDPVCVLPMGQPAGETAQMRGRFVFERMHSFIQNNLDHSLQAVELARLAGVSFRHLTRIFLQHGGQTPHRYVLRLRLEHARRMIENDPGIPVKEVAYQCGFSAPTHFTRAFRSTFKTTPTAFAAHMGA